MTTSFSSGSTVFGDSLDDNHVFTGSLIVSNSLTTHGKISGSELSVENHITASGNIDLGGRLFFESDEGSYIESHASDRVRIVAGGTQMLLLDQDNSRAVFGYQQKVFIGANNNAVPSNELEVDGTISGSGILSIEGNVTASGNISGSSTSTGSFGRVESSIASITEISSSGIQVNGNVTVNDDILVGEYIKHKGDVNTRIYFTDDRIRFQAGGIDFIGMHNKSSTPHLITMNNGSNNIDFQIKDNSNNTLFRTDADEQLVKFPDALQISGSATSTGSFGRAEINDNVSIGGDILLDEDQRIYFEEDKQTWIESNGANLIRIVTNNSQMLLLDHETGNRAVFGNGTKVFIGANNNELPSNELEVVGTISGSGILSIEGNITGSGNINTTGGRVFEQGTSVIDHATAMAIVFGG